MYVTYFSEFVKLNGAPKLDTAQFKRFMNVVYKEARNETTEKLTKNLTPELLMLEMLALSKKVKK